MPGNLRAPVAGALLLSTLLTACGVTVAGQPKSIPSSGPNRTAGGATTVTTTTTTTTTPPSPAPLPAAANGSDVNACRHGTCEVLVSGPETLPVDPSFGLSSLTVVDISPAGVDFRAIAADGTVVDMDEQRPDQGGPSVVDQLSVAVIASNGQAAVIRLSRAGT